MLPYDPTFLPETGLPGIDLEFTLLDFKINDKTSQRYELWTKSPTGSQSNTSHIGSIQLELPSDDALHDDLLGVENEGDASVTKQGLFAKQSKEKAEKEEEEEGVLLQPDFEFDENGNIIEFDMSNLSPSKRRGTSDYLRGSAIVNEGGSKENVVSSPVKYNIAV